MLHVTTGYVANRRRNMSTHQSLVAVRFRPHSRNPDNRRKSPNGIGGREPGKYADLDSKETVAESRGIPASLEEAHVDRHRAPKTPSWCASSAT